LNEFFSKYQEKDELFDVKVRGSLSFGPIRIVEADPTGEHFCCNSWHFSAYERKLADRGLCSFIPMLFSRNGLYYKHIRDGRALQLGIGSLPNVVGAKIAESDIRDLGMHTELCGDAYYQLFVSGKPLGTTTPVHNLR
jgi:acyl-CoA hydrolase